MYGLFVGARDDVLLYLSQYFFLLCPRLMVFYVNCKHNKRVGLVQNR